MRHSHEGGNLSEQISHGDSCLRRNDGLHFWFDWYLGEPLQTKIPFTSVVSLYKLIGLLEIRDFHILTIP